MCAAVVVVVVVGRKRKRAPPPPPCPPPLPVGSARAAARGGHPPQVPLCRTTPLPGGGGVRLWMQGGVGVLPQQAAACLKGTLTCPFYRSQRPPLTPAEAAEGAAGEAAGDWAWVTLGGRTLGGMDTFWKPPTNSSSSARKAFEPFQPGAQPHQAPLAPSALPSGAPFPCPPCHPPPRNRPPPPRCVRGSLWCATQSVAPRCG